MSRSNRHKEKPAIRSEVSQDNCRDGTAARTRPFSFNEIMHRRKKKEQSGDVEATVAEAGNVSVKDIPENVFDRSESGRGYRNNTDSFPASINHASEDFVKVSSRKKEHSTTMSEDKLVKRKDKDGRDSKIKPKASLSKDAGDKSKGGKYDRWGHGRRKNDEWSSGNSENETEKRRARDLVGKGRYIDRNRGKPENETKRKQRDEYDERSREKSSVKKHDSGKRHNSEILDRKATKELLEYHNELRSKKRRSRSRERDKDTGRRSRSVSPHKRTSHLVREHGELFSHKERSRRQESDDDRSKISNNGRRNGGASSGLGGYSPRKRRSEAAVKTPSPPHRSPEKKSAAWDLAPAGADVTATGSNVQSSNHTASANTYELSSVTPVSSTTVRLLPVVFPSAAVDSVQLTQATRPMRRLYVENLPASASEKAVMECLNNFLLSSGVNQIHGSLPCISCIIHKDKGHAVVEFLTPEDASAALSCDGRSFSGSILKIRRPKDYVEVATGVPEKTLAAADLISDIVRDSPHKIFIGGISKAISSEMLREIASAFGPLKAFHFELNMDLNESHAFLEYIDISVTLKACAGLNGMILGGQMLTVVLATPEALSVENIGNSPFYGIPEHAKLLLEKPTQVLKLKNVLDLEVLSSLSEPELEEMLEDIRVECSRYGTLKSVNFVRCRDHHTIQEKFNVSDDTVSARNNEGLNYDENEKSETYEELSNRDSEEMSRSKLLNNAKESEEVVEAREGGDGICGDFPQADLREGEMCESAQVDSEVAPDDLTCDDDPSAISVEINNQLNLKDQMECHEVNKDDNTATMDAEMENESTVQEKSKSEEDNGKLQEVLPEIDCSAGVETDALEKSEIRDPVFYLEEIFEPGCILVEYRRTEASSLAARCLHGRLFDNRIVTVGFVDCDIYKARFPK